MWRLANPGVGGHLQAIAGKDGQKRLDMARLRVADVDERAHRTKILNDPVVGRKGAVFVV